MGRLSRLFIDVALGAALGAAATVLVLRGGSQHPPTRVVVAGRVEIVQPGTTLAQAARAFHLHAEPGDLLDVEGRLLRRNAVPGSLFLDGAPAPPSTRLHNGDRIVVVDGRDQSERIRKRPVAGLTTVPDDPQFTLVRHPGRVTVASGVISHKVASITLTRYSSAPIGARTVALTFDDGPSEYTPRILAVLMRFRVPATFFVVGYLVQQYPQLIAAERRAGMTIGNHTYNHPEVPPFAELPARLVSAEVDLGAEQLERLGIEPSLFRPPAGSFSRQLVAAVEARGERIVLWSVDPRDWEPGASAKQIAQRVLSAISPGSIVILHDGGGDRSQTVRALPIIVKAIKRRGFQLVAVPAH